MGIVSQFDVGFQLAKALISVDSGQEGKLYVMLVPIEGHVDILGVLEIHILIYSLSKSLSEQRNQAPN